jgi:hypothetical protein
MANLRASSLKSEIEGCIALLSHWNKRLDADELPFSDGDGEIDEQPVVLAQLVADVALVGRKCEALVEIATDAHLG